MLGWSGNRNSVIGRIGMATEWGIGEKYFEGRVLEDVCAETLIWILREDKKYGRYAVLA